MSMRIKYVKEITTRRQEVHVAERLADVHHFFEQQVPREGGQQGYNPRMVALIYAGRYNYKSSDPVGAEGYWLHDDGVKNLKEFHQYLGKVIEFLEATV